MPATPSALAHALCVYAEPLAARRRVVVVGDSSLGLDARLVSLGARTIHVYDPDPARARAAAQGAARGVIIRELPAGELDVREGAFDLAIVPDLAAFRDRASLLVRVRRLVGAEGAALVVAQCAPAGEAATGGLDYYEMYDLVALQFASVRMIGQVPFTGVALAELGDADADPAVSVDTQLVEEADAPEVYIALAAQRDVRLEAYTIVQLPREAAAVREAPEAREASASPGPLAPTEADLAGAILRAELAESQLAEQRSIVARLTAEAERGSRRGSEADLEASLLERTNKLKDAETRAGDHYVRAERLTHELRRAEEELARQRDRASRAAKELEEEKAARTRLDSELTTLRKRPDVARARERIALLEEALRAAEEAVTVLQQRAVDAEKIIAQREGQIASLTRDVDALRAAASTPRTDPAVLASLAARAEQAEARAALLDAQLREHADAQSGELAELERLLRERAQAIAALEHELVRRERLVRELVNVLEEVGGAEALAGMPQAPAHGASSAALDEAREELRRARAETGDLRARLDGLALEVARREGELQARAWRIAELEEKVASFEARPAPEAPPAAKSSGAGAPANVLAELNALRRALAQEHESRVFLESGEELARARADLARQAVLLEQLARELELRPGQAAGPAQT
jgi:predicted  nucleic acid-binding Zn-ribbon protein